VNTPPLGPLMTFPFLSGRDSIEVPWPPALPGVTCETHHWMVILLQEVRQARHRLPGTWGRPLGTNGATGQTALV
jgi:hypothetical protein